jgi:hypothetical protein
VKKWWIEKGWFYAAPAVLNSLYTSRKRTCPWPGGKNGKPTARTSFMVATKFFNVLVITIGKNRKLAKPVNSRQINYLRALKVSPECFIKP